EPAAAATYTLSLHDALPTSRLEGVGRTGRTRPITGLGETAHPGRGATLRARGARRVRGTGGARAGAGLGHVAGARRGAAHGGGGLEDIRGTGRTRAVADLGHVARPRRRPTHRAGVPRRMLAGIARAVALVEGAGVAVGRARSPRRSLRIGRAGDPGAGPKSVVEGSA